MRKLVILVVALALFGAACGKDDKTESSGGTDDTTATTAGSPVSLPAGTPFHGTAKAKDGLEVELDNFYFGPTVIEADAGQTFKVELTNEGEAPHTFTIDSLSIDEQLAPDEHKEITITVPAAAGTIELYCRFHKASSNMVGALVVA